MNFLGREHKGFRQTQVVYVPFRPFCRSLRLKYHYNNLVLGKVPPVNNPNPNFNLSEAGGNFPGGLFRTPNNFNGSP